MIKHYQRKFMNDFIKLLLYIFIYIVWVLIMIIPISCTNDSQCKLAYSNDNWVCDTTNSKWH